MVPALCHGGRVLCTPAVSTHLHPTFDRLVSRAEKERLLGQRGVVIWLFGLSGSGKSTVAAAFERELHHAGRMTVVLDGDNVRTGLNRNLGFSDEDRQENIRRVAEVAKLFADAGVVTIVSFITPRTGLRRIVRETLRPEDLLLVYVRASFDTCARRDPKGLYAKAASGEVKQFTGRDSGFDEPAEDEVGLVLDTEAQDVPTCVAALQRWFDQRAAAKG
jgi:adenylylsulfate kinase